MRANGWTTVFHRKPDARYRVLYFPHAGGSAGSAMPLSAAAPPHVEVVAIQYPGRQWRQAEPAATDITAMAGEVAEALTTLDDKPTVILGHSMGAIVGFEVARLLEIAEPGLVTRLFASGSNAPSRPRRLLLSAGASDDELVDEMRLMGGTVDALFADPDVLRLSLSALRDDYQAMAAYRCAPDTRVSVPITALLGRDDPATDHADAAAWQTHTTESFALREFPGGHFYLSQCRCEVLDAVVDHFALLAGAE
ncbi:alpha/beta fold hydrolase [Nocardia sp. NBC_01499]|uniref:thioesterase II family protein n=1 Tax=Nocardia sp. NBC_01499 TaxID=2903597 RepID=UPI00386381D1